MIYNTLKIQKDLNGKIFGRWEEGSSASQHNVGLNKIKVVLDGFNLAPDESLYIAFSDGIEDDISNLNITKYLKMQDNFDGTHEIMIPQSVMSKRGTWYCCVAVFGGWIDDEPTTKSITSPLTFNVTATIKDINGKIVSYGDIETIHRQTINAISKIEKDKEEIEYIKDYIDREKTPILEAVEEIKEALPKLDKIDNAVDKAEEFARSASGSASVAGDNARLANESANSAEESKKDAIDASIEAENALSETKDYVDGIRGEINGTIETADDAKEIAERAELIAKGRSTSYVFDTYTDLENRLNDSDFISNLVVGDNLYILAKNVPDYWWTGSGISELESEKPDLSLYLKSSDYATSSKGGVVKINGFGLKMTDGVLKIDRATETQINDKLDEYAPITSKMIDSSVKAGIVSNSKTLTSSEKEQARRWLGAMKAVEAITKSEYEALTDKTGFFFVMED